MNKEQREEYGRIYDEVEKAVSGWGPQKREDVLIGILCMYVVGANCDARFGREHPLISKITEVLRRHGLKTKEEIMNDVKGRIKK